MLDFKNKTVLITGASKGIGETVAKRFLSSGAKVIVVSRNECIWAENNKNITLIKQDINNTVFFEDWIREFEKTHGRIDILINNAGIIQRKNLLETERKHIEEIFNVNFISTFLLSKVIASHMKKYNGGVIVNTLSFASKIPSVGSGIYAASKAALESLTKTMGAEWAPYNIRVNGYSPGVIETEMTKSVIAQSKKELLSDISLNRLGSTEEMADIVLFLASDQSSYLNGVNIDASGGKFIVQSPSKAWEQGE